MAKRIVLHAGHVNIGQNSIGALHGGSGAPGESDFTWDVANRVAVMARSRGITAVVSDANSNDDPSITGADWDLFLAIHYDADTYGAGGGLCGAPDASVDASNTESIRIRDALAGIYYHFTGIANHPERITTNMTYYYMWQYLSSKTPCVLIECGVGQHHPDDYNILQGDRNKVAEGITRGICYAFNISFDNPQAPSGDIIKLAHDIIWSNQSVWTKQNALKKLIPK